jgi:perosamine synthetase
MSTSLNHLPVPWWSVITDNGDFGAIEKVLESNFPNEGPVTLELEEFFKEFFKVKYAILTTSGTIALYLGLKALGIGPGDRVAVPDLTFIATANAVSLTGATPVLIDVIESTLCIDPEFLENEHSTSPLKAVIPVHISGRSALTEDLINVIKRLDLICVEDAAEAFGSRDPRTGKLLGTIGAVGAFSFSPNKIITSGQGGLVITNDDETNNKIRELKDQGRPKRGTGGDDLHNSVGFNFKFTDLQAAILTSQVKFLQKRTQHLIDVFEYYRESIKLRTALLNFQTKEGEFPLWPELQVTDRSRLESALGNQKIGFRKIWHPISTQIPYRSETRKLTSSLSASKKTLWLPSSFLLSKEDLERVVSVINHYQDSQ